MAALATLAPSVRPLAQAVREVKPQPLTGSNEAQRLRAVGDGFGRASAVRLRSEGVDAVIGNSERLQNDGPNALVVMATFGTDAAVWTLEAEIEGEWSPPVEFDVVAPRPAISAALAVHADVEKAFYTVNVFGTSLTRDSRVVFNGREVETVPIYSSPNATALTLGLRAMVPDALFDAPTREVQVWTPAPGGGVSQPFALPMELIPLTSRWAFWASLLAGVITLGLVLHRVRIGIVRNERLEAKVVARTAALRSEKARSEEQAERIRQQAHQLYRQAQRLASLDDAKSAFFINVSHEFGTPLSLVLQPLADLHSGLCGTLTADQRCEVQTALGGATRLNQLVGQVRDLARMESGTLHIRPQHDDLAPVLRRVFEDHLPLAERNDVALSLDAGDGLHAAHDAEAVRKMLSNLVSNGVRYTPPGGQVRLRAWKERDELKVEVRDTGPGIAPEDADRVFQRYVRSGAGAKSAPSGLGVGLAFARHLAELHGGRIVLDSAPGFGATFTVALPVDGPPDAFAPQDASAVVPDVLRQPTGTSGDGVGGDGSASEDVAAAPPDLALDPSEAENRPLVLVAEDHDELRGLLRRMLAPHYRVVEASDGAEALVLTEANRPDLVLSDVMMPRLDGVGLVEALRTREATADIPIILLSARANGTTVRRGLEAGADGYVNKPYDAPTLLARIHRAIKRRRQLQRRYADRVVDHTSGEVLTSMDDALYADLLRVTRERMHESTFKAADLAFEVNLSVSQLNRRLKAMGKPPAGTLLRQERLAQASRHLAARTDTVGRIAMAVGYSDVKHFSRVFKEEFGCSPSVYRQCSPAEGAEDGVA